MNNVITLQTVVDKLAAYLQHELSLPNLVTWAKTTLLEGEFKTTNFGEIRDVVARLGVADVRVFGLTWEDCEQLLKQLGFSPRPHRSMLTNPNSRVNPREYPLFIYPSLSLATVIPELPESGSHFPGRFNRDSTCPNRQAKQSK